MNKIKSTLEKKSDSELAKLAKLKNIKNYEDMSREKLIAVLVDKYEKTLCTTC